MRQSTLDGPTRKSAPKRSREPTQNDDEEPLELVTTVTTNTLPTAPVAPQPVRDGSVATHVMKKCSDQRLGFERRVREAKYKTFIHHRQIIRNVHRKGATLTGVLWKMSNGEFGVVDVTRSHNVTFTEAILPGSVYDSLHDWCVKLAKVCDSRDPNKKISVSAPKECEALFGIPKKSDSPTPDHYVWIPVAAFKYLQFTTRLMPILETSPRKPWGLQDYGLPPTNITISFYEEYLNTTRAPRTLPFSQVCHALAARQSAKVAQQVQPVQLIEPVEPTEMELVESMELSESVEIVEPAQRVEPVQRAQSSEPNEKRRKMHTKRPRKHGVMYQKRVVSLLKKDTPSPVHRSKSHEPVVEPQAEIAEPVEHNVMEPSEEDCVDADKKIMALLQLQQEEREQLLCRQIKELERMRIGFRLGSDTQQDKRGSVGDSAACAMDITQE